MAEFRAVCRVDDVKDGRAVAVEVEGLRVAIYNDRGAFYALTDRCPHAGGSMGSGWVEDGEAICPLHRWRFRLSSGRCTTAPGNPLHRFACELRDGEVWVSA